MKIKVKDIILVLFIITYAIKAITDGIYVANDVDSILISVKYIPMILAVILSFVLESGKREEDRKKIFFKEAKLILFVIICFAVISVFFIILNGKFTTNTISLLIKIFFSIAFAYAILNSLEMEDIYFAMKFVLVFEIIGYILQIGLSNFTLSNFKTISFVNSYSPFESHYFAGISIASCAFFSYFRKEKKWIIISFLFAVMTFKRLSIVFAILLLVLPWLINIDKKISSKILILVSIFFIIITFAYSNLLLTKNETLFYEIFGETQNKFTMGRSNRYNYLISNNFQSYGFGSASSELGLSSMEMDLVEINMELTVIGLTIFTLCYWFVTNGQIYCMIFMAFHFFNFLTSHSIDGNFGWTINFIIIGAVLYKNVNDFTGKRIKHIKIKLKGLFS